MMGPNEYVRLLADAAEGRGLEVVGLEERTDGGRGHRLVLRPGEEARNRHSGSVRISIEGIDLLGNLEALPSFQKEEE